MQQLHAHCELRTCYYALASLRRQRQALNYAQLQATVSSTVTSTGYNFLLTRRGEQDYGDHCD